MRRPFVALVTVVASLAVAAPAFAFTPPNDNFANRIDMSDVSFTGGGTNAGGATQESGEPLVTGGSGSTVWYQLVPPQNETFSLTTCGSIGTNTVLGVYTGTAVNALTPVGSNDDVPPSFCGTGPSVVTINGSTASTYKIQVDSASGFAPGSFQLHAFPGRVPFITDAVAGGVHVSDQDTVSSDSITFSFESSAPGGGTSASTYECSLDASDYEPCTSSKTLSGVANGQHSFDVRDTTSDVVAELVWTVNKPAAGTAATTTTPPAKDSVFAGVVASFAKTITVKGGKAKFKLTSPESSAGTLSGQTTQAFAASAAKKKRKRRVSVGKVKFTLTAGKAKTVTLKLSKKARKLLAKKGKLKVKITIDAKDAAGNRHVTPKTVTLKVKRKHKKK
jgi:hypothetical protein